MPTVEQLAHETTSYQSSRHFYHPEPPSNMPLKQSPSFCLCCKCAFIFCSLVNLIELNMCITFQALRTANHVAACKSTHLEEKDNHQKNIQTWIIKWTLPFRRQLIIQHHATLWETDRPSGKLRHWMAHLGRSFLNSRGRGNWSAPTMRNLDA